VAKVSREKYVENWRAVSFTAEYFGRSFRCYTPIEDLLFKTGEAAVGEFRKQLVQIQQAADLVLARAKEAADAGEPSEGLIQVRPSILGKSSV
jgi:hypothetical protein